nr:hypothetical protein [Kineosporia sp. NBRC 101731]
MSGQYDFGFSNTTSLLVAASQGLPLKVVGEGVASTGEKGKDFGGCWTRPAATGSAG